jgi:hypothetical protein
MQMQAARRRGPQEWRLASNQAHVMLGRPWRRLMKRGGAAGPPRPRRGCTLPASGRRAPCLAAETLRLVPSARIAAPRD